MSADLIEGLGATLCDLPPAAVPSSDRSVAFNISALVDRLGSRRAAARYLGVAESTVRAWHGGTKPKDPARAQAVAAAARAALVGRELLAAVKHGDRTLAVSGWIIASRDRRHRTVYPGRQIPHRTMQRIVRMWETAEPDEKVEASLLRAIDRYYTPLDFDIVERVWFE